MGKINKKNKNEIKNNEEAHVKNRRFWFCDLIFIFIFNFYIRQIKNNVMWGPRRSTNIFLLRVFVKHVDPTPPFLGLALWLFDRERKKNVFFFFTVTVLLFLVVDPPMQMQCSYHKANRVVPQKRRRWKSIRCRLPLWKGHCESQFVILILLDKKLKDQILGGKMFC